MGALRVESSTGCCYIQIFLRLLLVTAEDSERLAAARSHTASRQQNQGLDPKSEKLDNQVEVGADREELEAQTWVPGLSKAGAEP